ncbi:DUF6933 domain-containing protein [Paenibacillus amylolyticus]|uniref:DUF6933 domain-containing protein n=1 Tax=Paenibacillus amylolyticus TaxID=1451 RepID=UPI002116BC13|nr:DUF3024 domain-containing protein [Paenibacillus amylolyticus]
MDDFTLQMPVAQFRLDEKAWKVYWQDSKGKWHFIYDIEPNEDFERGIRMIIFKPTQLTLKDLNVKPETIKETDAFFSWHVNFFTLYGRKHYVFMNDFSRLSLTVNGIRTNQASKLAGIFKENLEAYFAVEEIPDNLANYYLDKCNEKTITKTDSRSVISTMNEIMLVIRSFEGETDKFKDKDTRHKWNNRFIYKPIDYKEPIDVFVKELQARAEMES